MEIYEQGKNKNKKTEKLRQYFDDVSDNPDVDNDDDYYSEDEYEEEFNNNYQSIELPILTKRKAIVKSIETHEITVIDGETGCGKSTQVPQFIADDIRKSKLIICACPKRLGTQAMASRVQTERKSAGRDPAEISFAMRDYSDFSNKTRIFFVTTGWLLVKLANSPNFLEEHKCSHLILDEVHERSVDFDLLCLMVKTIRKNQGAKKPKLILMSATHQAEDLPNYFFESETEAKDIHTIKVTERQFEIRTIFKDQLPQLHGYRFHGISSLDLSEDWNKRDIPRLMPLMCAELCELMARQYFKKLKQFNYNNNNNNNNNNNDSEDPSDEAAITFKIDPELGITILVFVPGVPEMEKLSNTFDTLRLPSDVHIHFLHGGLDREAQNKILAKIPTHIVRIIVSTNIAESAITIPNTQIVIDYGREKRLVYKSQVEIPKLELCWISKSSAKQRAGRAGRTCDGTVFRLYTEDEYDQWPEHSPPEIQGVPLEETLLRLKQMKHSKHEIFRFASKTLEAVLSPPSARQIFLGYQNLEQNSLIYELEQEIDQPKEELPEVHSIEYYLALLKKYDRFESTNLGTFISNTKCSMSVAKLLAVGLFFPPFLPMVCVVSAALELNLDLFFIITATSVNTNNLDLPLDGDYKEFLKSIERLSRNQLDLDDDSFCYAMIAVKLFSLGWYSKQDRREAVYKYSLHNVAYGNFLASVSETATHLKKEIEKLENESKGKTQNQTETSDPYREFKQFCELLEYSENSHFLISSKERKPRRDFEQQKFDRSEMKRLLKLYQEGQHLKISNEDVFLFKVLLFWSFDATISTGRIETDLSTDPHSTNKLVCKLTIPEEVAKDKNFSIKNHIESMLPILHNFRYEVTVLNKETTDWEIEFRFFVPGSDSNVQPYRAPTLGIEILLRFSKIKKDFRRSDGSTPPRVSKLTSELCLSTVIEKQNIANDLTLPWSLIPKKNLFCSTPTDSFVMATANLTRTENTCWGNRLNLVVDPLEISLILCLMPFCQLLDDEKKPLLFNKNENNNNNDDNTTEREANKAIHIVRIHQKRHVLLPFPISGELIPLVLKLRSQLSIKSPHQRFPPPVSQCLTDQVFNLFRIASIHRVYKMFKTPREFSREFLISRLRQLIDSVGQVQVVIFSSQSNIERTLLEYEVLEQMKQEKIIQLLKHSQSDPKIKSLHVKNLSGYGLLQLEIMLFKQKKSKQEDENSNLGELMAIVDNESVEDSERSENESEKSSEQEESEKELENSENDSTDSGDEENGASEVDWQKEQKEEKIMRKERNDLLRANIREEMEKRMEQKDKFDILEKGWTWQFPKEKFSVEVQQIYNLANKLGIFLTLDFQYFKADELKDLKQHLEKIEKKRGIILNRCREFFDKDLAQNIFRETSSMETFNFINQLIRGVYCYRIPSEILIGLMSIFVHADVRFDMILYDFLEFERDTALNEIYEKCKRLVCLKLSSLGFGRIAEDFLKNVKSATNLRDFDSLVERTRICLIDSDPATTHNKTQNHTSNSNTNGTTNSKYVPPNMRNNNNNNIKSMEPPTFKHSQNSNGNWRSVAAEREKGSQEYSNKKQQENQTSSMKGKEEVGADIWKKKAQERKEKEEKLKKGEQDKSNQAIPIPNRKQEIEKHAIEKHDSNEKKQKESEILKKMEDKPQQVIPIPNGKQEIEKHAIEKHDSNEKKQKESETSKKLEDKPQQAIQIPNGKHEIEKHAIEKHEDKPKQAIPSLNGKHEIGKQDNNEKKETELEKLKQEEIERMKFKERDQIIEQHKIQQTLKHEQENLGKSEKPNAQFTIQSNSIQPKAITQQPTPQYKSKTKNTSSTQHFKIEPKSEKISHKEQLVKDLLLLSDILDLKLKSDHLYQLSETELDLLVESSEERLINVENKNDNNNNNNANSNNNNNNNNQGKGKKNGKK